MDGGSPSAGTRTYKTSTRLSMAAMPHWILDLTATLCSDRIRDWQSANSSLARTVLDLFGPLVNRSSVATSEQISPKSAQVDSSSRGLAASLAVRSARAAAFLNNQKGEGREEGLSGNSSAVLLAGRTVFLPSSLPMSLWDDEVASIPFLCL